MGIVKPSYDARFSKKIPAEFKRKSGKNKRKSRENLDICAHHVTSFEANFGVLFYFLENLESWKTWKAGKLESWKTWKAGKLGKLESWKTWKAGKLGRRTIEGPKTSKVYFIPGEFSKESPAVAADSLNASKLDLAFLKGFQHQATLKDRKRIEKQGKSQITAGN